MYANDFLLLINYMYATNDILFLIFVLQYHTLTGQSIDPINSNYTGVMHNIHS